MKVRKEKVLEKDVVQLFRRCLAESGKPYFCSKIHQSLFSNRGFPDLVLILDGKTCFLEAKKCRGKLTELQELALKDIAVAGGTSGVLTINQENTLLGCMLLSCKGGILRDTYTYIRLDNPQSEMEELWKLL